MTGDGKAHAQPTEHRAHTNTSDPRAAALSVAVLPVAGPGSAATDPAHLH